LGCYPECSVYCQDCLEYFPDCYLGCCRENHLVNFPVYYLDWCQDRQ
jgi:hypothetical protein